MKSIVESGDLTPENDPTSPHKCHLFPIRRAGASPRAPRIRRRSPRGIKRLTTNLEPLLLELRQQPDRWQALLDLEATATAQPGYVDGGTHLIVAARSGPVVHQRPRV